MKVVGVDIWKGSWVAVVLEGGRFARSFVSPDIKAVITAEPDVEIIAIDIPIGLPEIGSAREADRAARAAVGSVRAASVFPAPPLELLLQASQQEANALARERGAPQLSAQAWGLRNAILQVESAAAGDKRIFEVHPEVSFAHANGGPLSANKTSWTGSNLRRRIIEKAGIIIPEDLGRDHKADYPDVIDAAICAWSAERILHGDAHRLPQGTDRAPAIWV